MVYNAKWLLHNYCYCQDILAIVFTESIRTVKAGPLVCCSTKIAKHADKNVKIKGK